MKELTTEQALNKAAALCSGSEHCTSQVREKLRQWGLSEDDAEGITSRLVAERFIDDRRFCRAYCHDRFLYSRWGRVKIRQMLRHLRLGDEEIAEGMKAIPGDDYQNFLNEALLAKDRTLHDTDPYQRKGKLVRHLLSRGFEAELVLDAVDAYLSRSTL